MIEHLPSSHSLLATTCPINEKWLKTGSRRDSVPKSDRFNRSKVWFTEPRHGLYVHVWHKNTGEEMFALCQPNSYRYAGGRLNIKMSSCQYRDPHVKDLTQKSP